MDSIFEERQAFNFYRSYYEVGLLLDDINRSEFIQAILHYQFTGEILELKNRDASIMFKGQMHSLKKQVVGFQRGKETYPNGNPTKGKDKGSYKEVQEKEEVQVKEKNINDIPFSKIKDFQGYLSSFTLNKTYFYIAYRFWELWKKENPNNKTILDAKVLKWHDAIRLIIEVDKQKVDRLLAIYFYFEKCHLNEVGFDRFWFDTVKSVGALRNKDKNDVYRIDKIIDKVNSKIQSDNFFNQYVNAKIAEFKKYEITKLH